MKYVGWVALLMVFAGYFGGYLVWRSRHVISYADYMPGTMTPDHSDVMYISLDEYDGMTTRLFAPAIWLDEKITGVGTVSE